MRVFRRRAALGGVAAAFALTVLIGTAAGQTAAAQLLAQFRGQRFAPITIDPSAGRSGLAQLARLGTVRDARPGAAAEAVGSLDEASRRVGFAVARPDEASLPAGLASAPTILVTPAHESRLTFDRAKAGEYFASVGRPDLALPDSLDGVALVVTVPAAALLRYDRVEADPVEPTAGLPRGLRHDLRRGGFGGSPGLVVGQARELMVGVEGAVTLDEVREFLLGLPGLPPDTVRQLRAIQDWRTTLPIPVPVDRLRWQATTIAGGEGLLFVDTSGLGGAALWQRDGRIFGVAGAAAADELRRVADGLR